MSSYYIIDSIQNARTTMAIEEVEKWINKISGPHAAYLANMALIKKVELIAKRYSEVE
jgi:hypothetical protein